MEISSEVVTEKKDSSSLPQTRVIRTYSQDAARLEGKSVPVPPIKQALPSVPETVTAPRADVIERPALGQSSISQKPLTAPTPLAGTSVPAPQSQKEASIPAEKKKSDMLVFGAERDLPKNRSLEEAVRTQKGGGPSPLHTYQIDFAEHIKKTNASPLSVLAAERDAARPEMPRAVTHKAHTTRYIVLGALLLLLGGGGSYTAYRYLAPEAQTVFSTRVTSLVFADEQQELFGSGPTLRDAIVASMADPLTPGAVRVLYTSTSTPESLGRQPVSGKEFIERLELSAPDVLIRNIYPESTVGVIATEKGNHPFFILKVSSFESTFRGMLDWETTIAADLALFYPTPAPAPSVAATTTETVIATTTSPVEASMTTPVFVDRSIANNDVRILSTTEGNTVLVYGYRDKTTLIIARDAAAFTELVGRLAATRQQ